MPSSTDIETWWRDHLLANSLRVAQVLCGPKRETWFSAEMFVALSSHTRPHALNPVFPDFACYGEQSYSTVARLLQQHAPALYGSRRPDLVAHDPAAPGSPTTAILELKLFLDGEDWEPELENLASQLRVAKTVFPTGTVLGVILCGTIPYRTPGTAMRQLTDLQAAAEAAMPTPAFGWVGSQGIQQVFGPTHSGFEYPSTNVALAMGVREAF